MNEKNDTKKDQSRSKINELVDKIGEVEGRSVEQVTKKMC